MGKPVHRQLIRHLFQLATIFDSLIAMHEPLHKHMHSTKCREIIEALNKCHMERRFGKFFGACNDLKRALDSCLKEEYSARRKISYEDSLISKLKLRELEEREKRSD